MAAQEGFMTRTAKNSISGTIAGIANCLVGHPFDTLKVRLQTQPVQKPLYNGLMDCFMKTLRWEGINGLYKGIASPIIGQMFFRATLFTSYFQVQSVLAGESRHGQRLHHSEYFLCGAVTGFFASFCEGPMDLFKTKMQIQIIHAKSGTAVQYRNVFHAAHDIATNHGIRGIYQGLGATELRNIPAFCAYFGFYELFRTRLTPKGRTVSELSIPRQLICGAGAGVLYWLLTYPTDVIKSTIQSDDSEKTKREYKNIIDCARKLYTEEGGVRRFFRGFVPCLLRTIPASSAMLLVMEETRRLLS